MTIEMLDDETRSHYRDVRELPDGRVIGTHRLLYHWTMHVGITPVGYDERYCFATYELAKKAFDEWSGEGDPEGWHRHPETGRRRNPETGEEWIEW